MRIDIAEKGNKIDWRSAGIPQKFLPILEEMRYKQGTTDAMFEGCTNLVTATEWKDLWRSRKKGTSPGLSPIFSTYIR